MINILNEGIHLIALVRDKNDRKYIRIEDNDYPNKEAFRRDLRGNGYVIRSIIDNRDLYVQDHSNYGLLSQVTNEIKLYMKWKKDAESDGRKFVMQDKLDELIDLQKKALEVEL